MDRVHEGASELEFSPQDIPGHAVKIAALAAVELTESILRRPGGREMLDRETERRRLKQREGAKGCTKMNLTMHLKKRF